MTQASKRVEICTFLCVLSMLPISGCQDDEHRDDDTLCESIGASITFTTPDARPNIVAAVVRGCDTAISTLLSCATPVSEVRFSSTGGPALCTFTLTSSNGQTFVASSSIEYLKQDKPYTCRDDQGAPHLVDSYRAFNPRAITVEFDDKDGGARDAQGCQAQDAGAFHDAQ
jgi:hypothetical protein